ncbi:hypothetical protein DPMN_011315 [Dreissena polymorpha]|uniref:Uncharacterized protein n=1 Tax=Dreissena polymorpha TaxID=45954 RepID=A0A9D4N4T8_DREPO|nr:hypothetical protein DPMN_011315 [Dreissena polymorpha]
MIRQVNKTGVSGVIPPESTLILIQQTKSKGASIAQYLLNIGISVCNIATGSRDRAALNIDFSARVNYQHFGRTVFCKMLNQIACPVPLSETGTGNVTQNQQDFNNFC